MTEKQLIEIIVAAASMAIAHVREMPEVRTTYTNDLCKIIADLGFNPDKVGPLLQKELYKEIQKLQKIISENLH